MNYEMFVFTKTSRDDWNFHIVPDSLSQAEINKIREIIVDGLYSSFPSISKNEILRYQAEAVESHFNFCYFLPSDNALALILSRVSKATDYTGRPFWDFVGAHISLATNSLNEIKYALPFFLANNILFKVVDQIIDQDASAPKPPRRSEVYSIDIETINPTMVDDQSKNTSDVTDPFLEESPDPMLFFEASTDDYNRLFHALNNPLTSLFFFSMGPSNRKFILEKVEFQAYLSRLQNGPEVGVASGKVMPSDQQGLSTKSNKKNRKILDVAVDSIIYSISVADVILNKMKTKNKK